MNGEALVFDGDDTLWISEPLYDRARASGRALMEEVGLPGSIWESLQRRIDLENVATMGLSSDRFPTSFAQAYGVLCDQLQKRPEATIKNELWETASMVFTQKAELVDGALSVLEDLESSHQLVLLTQGERWVQERRVKESGFADLFSHIRIVSRKSPEAFATLLMDIGASPKESWSIGNSLPSDIYTALAIGMSAFWIDSHVWEFERRHANPIEGRLMTLDVLTDLPYAFGSVDMRVDRSR